MQKKNKKIDYDFLNKLETNLNSYYEKNKQVFKYNYLKDNMQAAENSLTLLERQDNYRAIN